MNRKYIGLAKHELLLAKKRIVVNLITYLALMLVAVLIYMSMRVGNMKEWIGEDVGLTMFMRILFIAMGAVVPVTTLCVTYDDFKSGWQKYCYTLPVSIDEHIKFKFGMKIVGFFLAMMLGIINMGVIAAASGEALGKRDWLIFAVTGCMAFLNSFVQLPLIMKTKNNTKADALSTCFVMVFALGIITKLIGVTKSFLDKHGFSSVDNMPIELQPELYKEIMGAVEGLYAYAWVLLIFAAAVITVSVLWTKKMLKERIC